MIALPARWRRAADPDHGVLVSARCPSAGASGVVPLIRLEVAPVAGSLHEWRERDLAAVSARRSDFELDDEDVYDLAGRAVAYRRFAFRRADDDLLCEQWAWLEGRRGYTLTCTVGRADYADFCELFEDVAATFDPGLSGCERSDPEATDLEPTDPRGTDPGRAGADSQDSPRAALTRRSATA